MKRRQIFCPAAKVPPIPSDKFHEGNNLVWDKWDGLEDRMRSESLRRWMGCCFSILGNVRAHDGPNCQEGDLRSPDLLPRRTPPVHEVREPVGSSLCCPLTLDRRLATSQPHCHPWNTPVLIQNYF